MIARCGWCRSPFLRDRSGHYWCQTLACRDRQATYAITFTDRMGRVVPWKVPLPKQVDFETAPVPYLLGGGAAGVSKSTAGRYGLYRRALSIPNFEGLILRQTWKELETHQLRLMEREALDLTKHKCIVPVDFSMTRREMRFEHPEGVAIIEGGHMDDLEDVVKYTSRERDAIVLDEASRFKPALILELSTRARSSKAGVAAFTRALWNLPPDHPVPRGGAVFWCLSNPDGPAGPMLRDFFIDHTPDVDQYPQLAECGDDGQPLYVPEEWGYVPGNLEDNPYITPDYERSLALLLPAIYQARRYNNWDVVVGQFFGEFDTRTHVRDLGDPGPSVTWFRSYDYGYQVKGVVHWWAVLSDDRLYVRHEYAHQHTDLPVVADQMRQQTKALGIRRIAYTVADKFSMGSRTNDQTSQTRRELLLACGIPTTMTDHDQEQGWTMVRSWLHPRPDGMPGVIIHPTCRLLIRELTAATSDKAAPETIDRNFPQDALSSFRYGIMSRPRPRPLRRPELPPNAMGRILRTVQDEGRQRPFQFR